jgi:glycerophosphoryl diester phosphodiesterase
LPIAQTVQAQAINPNFKALNESNVKKIQQAGYQVFPYTINETEGIKKMISLRVDGIITDFPERIAEVLSSN